MNRYAQLLGIIQEKKPRTIIEVGTWNGDRAIEMATQLLADGLPCHYVGFDLFEEATDATDLAELNVKPHVRAADVREKLQNFADTQSNGDAVFTFKLYKGNTRQTIPNADLAELEAPVLGFIDGGHSHETIASDVAGLVDYCDYLVLDDYYQEDEDSKGPDLDRYGCNRVLENLVGEKGKHWHILPMADRVKDGGYVQMVWVGETPPPEIEVRKELNIRSKNAVSDDAIQRNILYSLSQGFPEISRCYPHGTKCVFISGGESFKENIEKIRQDQSDGHFLVCVKTSHDYLIKEGIVPDACVLLDPRAHVTDFINPPHSGIHYYAASQVFWETTRHLVSHNAKVTLYHAMVNAGEQDMLGEGRVLICGGSTAATRGIALMHALGFRDFKLYGYDSSFLEKPSEEYIEQMKDRNSKRLIRVRVLEKDFWTTPELVVQSQNFEELLKPASPNDARFEVVGSPTGETLINHMFKSINRNFSEWDRG